MASGLIDCFVEQTAMVYVSVRTVAAVLDYQAACVAGLVRAWQLHDEKLAWLLDV